jgi:hypothetical protein
MLISGSIPNLIGGVSQQPDALRLINTGKRVENAWLSVVNGLGKRPPSEHLARTTIDPESRNMIGYLIDRDENYRFIVTIAQDTLRVFDLQGIEQTVNFPNGRGYLSSALDPIDAFRFVTVGDTTFVLNRERQAFAVDYGEEGTFTYTPDGTVDEFEDLPGSPAEGDVYYVTNEQRYYSWEEAGGVPEITGWRDDTLWQLTIPSGYTSVGRSLPAEVTAGRKVYLTARFNTAGPKETSSYSNYYRGYTGVVTQESSGATLQWVPKRVDQLTTVTNSRKDPAKRATVHVAQAVPNSYYAVYINSLKVAEFLTNKNTSSDNVLESTTVIASELRHDLNAAGYTTIRKGSSIIITNLSAGDTVEAWTTNGDKALKAYRDSVQAFDDLPPNEEVGRIVAVAGDLKEGGDDYFVEFTNKNLWRETKAYGGGGRLVASSMPHVLVREADGTWTFKQHTWAERMAGSAESNPAPSFDRRKIRDIFVWNNRLGLIADENIILSTTGDYEDFYRSTLVLLEDSDPLDFAVLHNQVNILQHAVPFAKDLLLFSNQNQFRFTFQNFLGPKNVQVQYTTSFTNSPRIHPINIGASVYFVDDQESYLWSKLYEYFLRDDGQADDAEDVTAATPEYINGGARWMAGSAANKFIAVGTDGKPKSIFVYKFFWAGERKIQTSWTEWTFEDCERILWGGITRGYLYLLVERDRVVFLERIDIEENVITSNTDFTPYLDRRTPLDLSRPVVAAYNAKTKKTRITVPWGLPPDQLPEFVTSEPVLGPDSKPVANLRTRTPQVTRHEFLDNQFYVEEDYTKHTNAYAGLPYTFVYEFSKVYLRVNQGEAQTAHLDSRFQMRRMNIEYHDTVAFTAKLTLPGRAPWTTDFFSNIAGTPLSEFGKVPFASGTFRFPLLGENTVVKLEISNDTPYPCYFGSAEWAAMYQPKAKRM